MPVLGMMRPTLDETRDLIDEEHSINVILDQGLCWGGATAIPNDALWVDARYE